MSPVASHQLVDIVDARSATRVHPSGSEHPLVPMASSASAGASTPPATAAAALGELVEHRHDPDRWIAHLGLPPLPEV